MAEQKAVCGGFLVGDGLEMNGKVLSATGGGGAKSYVEDDDGNIIGAGKDIQEILINGGFLALVDEEYNYFYHYSRNAGGVYGFYLLGVDGTPEVYGFEIVGDDLIAIEEP